MLTNPLSEGIFFELEYQRMLMSYLLTPDEFGILYALSDLYFNETGLPTYFQKYKGYRINKKQMPKN